MKTCLLNLPYSARIMRRYTCTYYAPNFLYPPLELMYLGAIIKEWKKDDCILIDAIAERLNLNRLIVRLEQYQPQLLVFMSGIESFTEDMQAIMNIKSYFPLVKIACIGYLPSLFPKETLSINPAIDYIVMDEPEVSFSEIYDAFRKNIFNQNVQGVAYRDNGNIIIPQRRQRIKDLDLLPFPARSLVNTGLYNEFLLKRPFTTIQTSRGCPFGCTFCIPHYGREIVYRSVGSVLKEVEEAIFKYRVRTVHFTDDIFTLNKNRVMELCGLMLKNRLKLQWSALSRVGMLDREMLKVMHSSGLRRIYLGIETGSQRLLDFYRKGYRADSIKEQIRIIKENNVEVGGFFIVGGFQTEEEFRKDILLARQLNLDYVLVEKITPYPGTELFESIKNKLKFNLFPYSNRFKDNRLQEEALRREKLFYRQFFFNPSYFIKKIKYLFLSPRDFINGAKKSIHFLFCHKNSQETRPELI